MHKLYLYSLWIFLFLLLRCQTGNGAEAPLKFSHLSLQEGLSSTTVFSIVQDHQGYLWFGTMDGLHKYDGYTIQVFKNNPADSTTVSNNNSGNLLVDSKGFIWIGSWGGGLDKFDPVSGKKIRHYYKTKDDSTTISGNRVQSLFEDSRGYLWFGTYKDGLNRLDTASGEFTYFSHQPDDSGSLSHNRIWSINEDQQGCIWLATSYGLNVYTPGSRQFKHFFHRSDDPHSLSNNRIRVIYIDRYGGIWIGTQNGLNRYHPETNTFTRYLYLPSAGNNYGWHTITSVLQSKTCGDSMLWVGTSNGLFRLNIKTGQYSRYVHTNLNPNSLSANDIRALYEDKSGIIWIATRGGGVNKLNPNPRNFEHYYPDVNNPNSLTGNRVWAILSDYQNNNEEIVWIGTNNGLNKWERKTNKFLHYFHNPEDSCSISDNEIWSIYKDSKGNIWFGSRAGLDRYDPSQDCFVHYSLSANNTIVQNLGGLTSINEIGNQPGTLWLCDYSNGLFIFNPGTGNLRHFVHLPEDSTSLSHSEVWCVFQDSRGNVWIGTGDGLNRMDVSSQTFTRIPFKKDGLLAHFRVFAIYEDKNGRLWLATDDGLWRYDTRSKQYIQIGEKDGLPDQRVVGILNDNSGNLWLSTNKGLCRLNPDVFQIKVFGIKDGIQSNEFSPGAYHRSPTGEFFFGGINGFNTLQPEELFENMHAPEVLITDLKIFNKTINPASDANAILHTPISVTKVLTLPSRYNVFSLEFVGLDFVAPMYNRYAYKLEGFDKEWMYTNASRRFATYTNLDAGEYTFRVKASNSDHIWSKNGASLKIIIQPPFWHTWWFRLSSGLFFIFLIYFFYSRRVSYIHNQKMLLEQKVSERTRALLSEIQEHKRTELRLQQAIQKASLANKAKREFLANMSHEIRTPMNGVIGMIHLLLNSGLNSEQYEYVAVLKRSANFLLEIINDILDFSKIEAGRMELENIDFGLRETIENLCEMAALKAFEKKLQFYCIIKNDIPDAIKGDPVRLRQVLLNLISNAIKFTEKGGISIEVGKVKENDKKIKLAFSVHDTGIGIPPDAVDKLFQSFSQVDGSTTRKYGGTGLGLAISKQLVDLMGGTIRVKSKVGKGSTFWVVLEFEKQDNPPQQKEKKPDLTGKQVLIADQYVGNLAVLNEYLEAYHCTISKAQSLAEMLLALERKEPFDFIFADIELSGLNEAVISNLIKNAGIKLVLTGPVGASNPFREFINKGLCAHLDRPIRKAYLENILTSAMGKTEADPSVSSDTKLEEISAENNSILLAEDNLINQKLVIRLLEKMGFKVDAVVNGKLAYEALKEKDYDLVLMDLQMPVMDGIKATQLIRQQDSQVINPQIPIVALTANIRQEDRKACFDAGMNGFLTKPIKINELKDTLLKFTATNTN